MRFRILRSVAAVLLGNAIFLLIEPQLPAELRHRAYEIDLGLFVDFLICVGFYMLFGWLAPARGRVAGDAGNV